MIIDGIIAFIGKKLKDTFKRLPYPFIKISVRVLFTVFGYDVRIRMERSFKIFSFRIEEVRRLSVIIDIVRSEVNFAVYSESIGKLRLTKRSYRLRRAVSVELTATEKLSVSDLAPSEPSTFQ